MDTTPPQKAHQLGGLWPVTEGPLLDEPLFRMAWAGTLSALSELLGKPYPTKIHSLDDPIAKTVRSVWQYYEEGPAYLRDWEAHRLGLLAMELERLRNLRPEIYRSFRKRYRKITQNEYFGFRHEILIAERMASKGIPYEKTEAPDFTVTGTDGPAYIECASVNMVQSRARDTLYKLVSAVAQKSGKPYANISTALCLDFTNVFYNSALSGSRLQADEISRTLHEEFPKTRYGALIATALVNDIGKRKYRLVGDKVIAEAVPDPLRSLLSNLLEASEAEEIQFGIPFSV